MGARLFNNPRTTNRGNVNAFPALQISALRKFGAFKQGQWTAVRYGAAVLILSLTVICFGIWLMVD